LVGPAAPAGCLVRPAGLVVLVALVVGPVAGPVADLVVLADRADCREIASRAGLAVYRIGPDADRPAIVADPVLAAGHSPAIAGPVDCPADSLADSIVVPADSIAGRPVDLVAMDRRSAIPFAAAAIRGYRQARARGSTPLQGYHPSRAWKIGRASCRARGVR